MRTSDPEGFLTPQDESITARVCLIGRVIGNAVLDHVASVTAVFKLTTGLDATSPFTPRETRFLIGDESLVELPGQMKD